MNLTDSPAADQPAACLQPFSWKEREILLLILLAVALFLPRLTLLTVRGEESRRAVIAREMVETGDWLVPRTQGVVRLSRPPFQNWLIAGLALVGGGMSTWAIRLPGMVATVLTVVLIYWYARTQLPRSASFVAAAVYATMLQVIEQGRTGETEPVFTLLVAASLLVWHGGWLKGWRPEVFWALGAACAALATLTKGLQGPIYFFASTWAYLIVTGEGRRLVSRGHLVGLLTFLAVVGAWQVPFTIVMGLDNGWMIYFKNVAGRFADRRWTTFVTHLLTYPPSVVVGCLAPWSVLLLAFVDRDVRQQVRSYRDMLWFLVTAIIVCFPSVWLPPEARPRYFMPLFPCFAVVIAIAAQGMMTRRTATGDRIWWSLIATARWVIPAAAMGWVVASCLSPAAPSLAATSLYAALCVALTVIAWKIPLEPTSWSLPRGTALIGGFLGLTYVLPMLSYMHQRSENLPAAMAALKSHLPEDARLASFGHVHHLFLHTYGRPVSLLPWPENEQEIPADVTYFCVQSPGTQTPLLPFQWEPVARLSVDRTHHPVPKESVIVGRITGQLSEEEWSSRSASGRVIQTSYRDDASHE